MDALVSKVLTARAKQKQAIEKNSRHLESIRGAAEESTKPIVEAITKIQHQPPPEPQPLPEPEPIPAIENNIQDEVPFELSMGGDKWAQDLYKNFRNQKKSRTTQLEADLQGSIGLIGKVNMPLLFNYNELEVLVQYDDKTERIVIGEDDLKEGLVALILLPLADLEESNIKPTSDDWRMYRLIMNHVQFRRTSSRKLTKLLKFNVGHGIQTSKLASSDCECIKDKQERLYLLLGSIQAGNTNQEMRQEAQQLLDDLLTKRVITEAMHKKFFIKYKLH